LILCALDGRFFCFEGGLARMGGLAKPKPPGFYALEIIPDEVVTEISGGLGV
jgi:hypothetical protein